MTDNSNVSGSLLVRLQTYIVAIKPFHVLTFLAGLALVHNIVLFVMIFDQPFKIGVFRQAHTAITAQWLLKGGDWLIYETPILGAPWKIPLDFPLYQWMMAALTAITDLTLIQSGRIISLIFWIATLWPVYRLTRRYMQDNLLFLAIAILFLCAPQYLVYGPAVLMETLALFSSFMWLDVFANAIDRKQIRAFILPTVWATIAISVKITTFMPFAILGALILIRAWKQDGTLDQIAQGPAKSFKPVLNRYWPLIPSTVIPIGLFFIWLDATEFMRDQAPIAKGVLGSEVYRKLVMPGGLPFQAALWRDAIALRAVPNALGYSWGLIPMAALLFTRNSKYFWPLTGLMAAFLLPMMLFSFNHQLQPYYQTANAAFLIIFCALACLSLTHAGRPALFAVSIAVIAAFQISYFYENYSRNLFGDSMKRKYHRAHIELSDIIQNQTDPDSVIVVFGTGYASTIPFYSERRSLSIPFSIESALLQKTIDQPEAFTGGLDVSAHIFCEPRRYMAPWPQDKQRQLNSLEGTLKETRQSFTSGPCRLYLKT